MGETRKRDQHSYRDWSISAPWKSRLDEAVECVRALKRADVRFEIYEKRELVWPPRTTAVTSARSVTSARLLEQSFTDATRRPRSPVESEPHGISPPRVRHDLPANASTFVEPTWWWSRH